MWTRRKFLSAIAAQGALGATIGVGCSSFSGSRTPPTIVPTAPSAALDEAFAILANTDAPLVWSRFTESHQIQVDSDAQHHELRADELVILQTGQHTGDHTVHLRNATADAIVFAATQLASKAGTRPSSKVAKERNSSRSPNLDTAFNLGSVSQATNLLNRARTHGNSRVVYRNASLGYERVNTRLLRPQIDRTQQALRAKAGLLVAVWTGDDVVTANITRAGSGGQPLLEFTDEELAATTSQALAQLHARSAPSGLQDVVLAPDVACAFTYHAMSDLPSLRHEFLSIVDIPTDAASYGATAFDDMGNVTTQRVLVGAEPSQPFPILRRDALGELGNLPCNLRVSTRQGEDRTPPITQASDGVLLEGPLYASMDSGVVSLVCSHAREIRQGRFTGRVFGRTLMRSPRSDFLSATRALGEHTFSHFFTVNGLPISVSSPAWLSRARLSPG